MPSRILRGISSEPPAEDAVYERRADRLWGVGARAAPHVNKGGAKEVDLMRRTSGLAAAVVSLGLWVAGYQHGGGSGGVVMKLSSITLLLSALYAFGVVDMPPRKRVGSESRRPEDGSETPSILRPSRQWLPWALLVAIPAVYYIVSKLFWA